MAKNRSNEERPSKENRPWELQYHVDKPSKAMRKDGGSSFVPRSAKDRPVVHEKINEQDY